RPDIMAGAPFSPSCRRIPSSANSLACSSDLVQNLTSSPELANLPPNSKPSAPAPTISTFILSTLFVLLLFPLYQTLPVQHKEIPASKMPEFQFQSRTISFDSFKVAVRIHFESCFQLFILFVQECQPASPIHNLNQR